MLRDLPISWAAIRWLLDEGVPPKTVSRCATLRTIGDAIAFYEEMDDDLILWSPRSGKLASDRGAAFALGGSDLSAASGALQYLQLHADPLDWLRADGAGIVVVDWKQAFDRLRYVPRVAVAEPIAYHYRRAMRPAVPDMVTLADRRLAA